MGVMGVVKALVQCYGLYGCIGCCEDISTVLLLIQCNNIKTFAACIAA